MGSDFFRRTAILPGTAYVVASDAPAVTRRMALIEKARFGALIQICDGVADNVEIQAAITASAGIGARVLLMGSTFYTQAPITFIDNLIFDGSGAKIRSVAVDGSAILSASGYFYNLQVKNLILSNGSGLGINWYRVTGELSLLENISIFDCVTAGHFHECHVLIVRNVEGVRTTGAQSFDVLDTNDIVLDRVSALVAAGNGFVISGGANSHLIRSRVENCDANGISIIGAAVETDIDGLWAEIIGLHVLSLSGAGFGGSLRNSHIQVKDDVAFSPIYVDSYARFKLDNNRITTNTPYKHFLIELTSNSKDIEVTESNVLTSGFQIKNASRFNKILSAKVKEPTLMRFGKYDNAHSSWLGMNGAVITTDETVQGLDSGCLKIAGAAIDIPYGYWIPGSIIPATSDWTANKAIRFWLKAPATNVNPANVQIAVVQVNGVDYDFWSLSLPNDAKYHEYLLEINNSGLGIVPTAKIGACTYAAIWGIAVYIQETTDNQIIYLDRITFINYVTENSGTATIAAGQVSVNVTHGLATTPTRVVLTPTTDTAGRRYWVSAKAAATFTITIDSLYAADIVFDWRAVVGEGN